MFRMQVAPATDQRSFCMHSVGHHINCKLELTGRTFPKYFSHVLLGSLTLRTFPVTENLTPDGSVTDTGCQMTPKKPTENYLQHFLISLKSAITSAGESCRVLMSLGMNSA